MIQQENTLKQVHQQEFKHLLFEIVKEEHIVSLVDDKGYKITSGYGNSIIEAMNDMHRGLI